MNCLWLNVDIRLYNFYYVRNLVKLFFNILFKLVCYF